MLRPSKDQVSDNPFESRSLLLRIESPVVRQQSLLDRMQSPIPEVNLSPHWLTSTPSSPIAGRESSPSPQPPERCLSPWIESRLSRPLPERRHSSPISPKSTQLIDRLSNPQSLLSRIDGLIPLHSKRGMGDNNQAMPPHKRVKTSSPPPDEDSSKLPTTLMTKTHAIQNGAESDRRTCPGLESFEEERQSTETLAVSGPVNSLNSTERTCHAASFSCEPLLSHQKGSPSHNGSGSSAVSPLISTISYLQLSALRSMRSGRLALEQRNLPSTQLRRSARSKARMTGLPHGAGHLKLSTSLSPTVAKNSTRTIDTYNPSLMSNSQDLTTGSLHTTSQSATMSVEGSQPYSPTERNFHTCTPLLSSRMELNLQDHPEKLPRRLPRRTLKHATNTTQFQGALTLPVDIATHAKAAEKTVTRSQPVRQNRASEVGLEPKYLRYNLWGADHQSPTTIADWSERALPLPRPPCAEFENTNAIKTLAAHPDLFKVVTPINIDHFELLLSDHPNRPFVASVLEGLREGFWPWGNTTLPGYPSTHSEEPKGIYDDAHRAFFRTQLQHEQSMSRYSSSFGPSLLPGMYSMPIYAVPKPNSTDLRLVNDHSAGEFSLNSMIDHARVTGYPLDNLHQLGQMLLAHKELYPNTDLVMWKSDIAEAYRMCPLHPLWQLKQAVRIDDEYYIDRVCCFGSSASFAIFASVNSLIAWVAQRDRGIHSLITYVDDSSGPAVAGDMDLYKPYNTFYPSEQTALLRLWDELGVPHKAKKQVNGDTLPVIGIVVDPNRLSFTLPDASLARLVAELEMWVSPKSTRFRLKRWQQLAGWINWALNVFPLLRPCLNTFYRKIAGKTHRNEYLRINKAIREDFAWALRVLGSLRPVFIADSLSWAVSDASMTIYCDACLTGMGFWVPQKSLGFHSPAPSDAPGLIFYLEALCVLSALEYACANSSPQGRVVLYTDNQNTVDIFSSLHALPAFNWMLQRSVDLRLQADVSLRVLHIPGAENQIADALSRSEVNRATALCHSTACALEISSFSPAAPLQPPCSTLGAVSS